MGRLLTILLLVAVLVGTSEGQRLVTVQPNIVDELATVIKNDSTARRAALPTQTIYVLKRNGFYPVVSAIENRDFFLHIKAEAGTGYRPYLQPSPATGGGYPYNINFRSNGKLEGLTLDASRPTGGVNNRYINVYKKAKLWVKDCEVLHDRGGAFCLQEDSTSVFVEDCFVHSIGHPKSVGGNGRVVDVRNIAYADSVVVQNTTFFNLSDRIIRIQGNTRVTYVKFDHNTGFTTQGYHGGVELGRTLVAIVTNNIFYNPIAYGSAFKRVYPAVISEQEQPEKTLMHVITIDTLYANSKIEVRNNNIFWDQAYKDLWLKWKDSTTAPGYVTSTIMKALLDSTKAYFTEPLTFQAPPRSIINFIDSALAFPNSTVLPENWSFDLQDSTNTKPINGSYGTTAASYTKADGGFPLGDLNWYPALKARWLNNLPADVDVLGEGIPSVATLAQNYPNPFNPETVIRFTIPQRGSVSLKVYDVLGRMVSTLVDGTLEAGQHSANFSAQRLASGVYFYTLTANGQQLTKHLIVLK